MFHQVILCWFLIFLISGVTAQKITFNKHIGPIIETNCAVCHYRGGPTPFPLSNYKEVEKKARFIAHVTEKRIMPPWKANPEYRHFANERIMSDDEIELIQKWVDQGAKRGCFLGKNNIESIREDLGNPDLELYMPKPVQVKGNNQNIYYYYKIPYELEKDTFARAFEFIPDNVEVLHHATFQIVKPHESARIQETPYMQDANREQQYGGNHFEYLNLVGADNQYPEVVYANSWLPGSTVQIYPKEMSFHLPKKGVILFNYIHYSPSPIDQTDSSGIRFYFSKARPENVLKEVLFKPNFSGIEGVIPKDSIKTVRLKKTIRGEMTVYTVIPHMHRLGKYFKAWAIDPGGDTIPLVEIKEWDFNWQEYYRFEKPLVLKPGTAVYAEAIYDNTENNLANPSHPPVDVYFNNTMNEDSEMMHLLLLYTAK